MRVRYAPAACMCKARSPNMEMMATLTTGSRRENFKTFAARKKAEYRSNFPFLTDSQIVAKLKRVWKTQQAREAQTTEKSSTTDKKSKKSNRFPANGSRCQAVVLSEEINTPEEEEKILGPRHKVKPPPPQSTKSPSCLKQQQKILHARPPSSRSSSNKENVHLTITTNIAPVSPSEAILGGPCTDCYAFIDNEDDDGKQSETASLEIKHKRKAISRMDSSSLGADQQPPTGTTSLQKSCLKEPNIAASSNSRHSRSTTHTSGTITTRMTRSRQDHQSQPKPSGGRSTALRQRRGKTNNGRQRNAAAAVTNNESTTSVISTICTSTSGGGSSVVTYDGVAVKREDDNETMVKTQTFFDVLGESDLNGSQRLFLVKKDVNSDKPDAKCPPGLDTHLQRGEENSVKQETTSTIVVAQERRSTRTITPCVDEESQTMEEPLAWLSNSAQGNVESSSGSLLPDCRSEISHVHNALTTTTTGTATTVDVDNHGCDSADSSFISGVLGNPKTDSTPTVGCDSASRSPAGSQQLSELVPLSSGRDPRKTNLVVVVDVVADGDNKVNSGASNGRRGTRKRGRGRGREQRKKDPNELWMQTNSQPQTCDHIGNLVELSQSDYIPCSLPSDLEELPPLSVETAKSRGSTKRGGGKRSRASLRARKRQHGAGGGRTSTTNVEVSGRMTRSRTAALIKSSATETDDKENLSSSSSDAKIDHLLPPTKKQKPRQSGKAASHNLTAEYLVAGNDTVAGASTANTSVSCRVLGTMANGNINVRVCTVSVTGSPTGTRCSTDHGACIEAADGAADGAAVGRSRSHGNGSGVDNERRGKEMTSPGLEEAAESSTSTKVAHKSSSPSPCFAQCSSSAHSQSQSRASGPTSMKLQSPSQVDPLCDMFLPLTPERKKCDLYKDIGSFYNGAPTERRTFQLAVESDEKGYCLFADDADIFL